MRTGYTQSSTCFVSQGCGQNAYSEKCAKNAFSESMLDNGRCVLA